MLIKLRRMMTNQKGFTLIELLVVISILGVLAAIVVPKFTDATAKANTAKIAADLRTIDSAIAMNQAMKGVDPATILALVTNKYLASEPVLPTGAYLIGTTSTPISGSMTYGFSEIPSNTTTTSALRSTFNSLTSDHFK